MLQNTSHLTVWLYWTSLSHSPLKFTQEFKVVEKGENSLAQSPLSDAYDIVCLPSLLASLAFTELHCPIRLWNSHRNSKVSKRVRKSLAQNSLLDVYGRVCVYWVYSKPGLTALHCPIRIWFTQEFRCVERGENSLARSSLQTQWW